MESLDFMVAQAFTLDSATTATATDQLGAGRTITIQATSGPFYYRTFLANYATGVGSAELPFDLLRVMEDALGGVWTVALTALGLVRFTYTGTATGTLTLPSSVKALLGFTGTIGPLATGASQTADYQPTHCVFSLNFSGDDGWMRRPPRVAAQTMPDGRVYGLTDRTPGALRRVTMQLHPKNQTVKAAWNVANPTDPMLATPAFPPDSRYLSSYTGEPGQSPPWSVLDTLNIQVDQSWAVAFGNLQELIAGSGSDLTFDVCYPTPTSMQSGGVTGPSAPNWDARYDIRDVELSLVQKGATR
jgi:hypothetical protein